MLKSLTEFGLVALDIIKSGTIMTPSTFGDPYAIFSMGVWEVGRPTKCTVYRKKYFAPTIS